jgi:hypothetical protein
MNDCLAFVEKSPIAQIHPMELTMAAILKTKNSRNETLCERKVNVKYLEKNSMDHVCGAQRRAA